MSGLQYFYGIHTEYEPALGPISALTQVDVNGSTSVSWEWGSLGTLWVRVAWAETGLDILAELLKKSCLSLWRFFSLHKPAAVWLWKTPAETTGENWKHISTFAGFNSPLLLFPSGTLGRNCWPLFSFLNYKNYGRKVQWIGGGKLLCLWASFPMSIKSTNKSNIAIYTSWGLCEREAKRVPVAWWRWLRGHISIQVMGRSFPVWARGNSRSRWTWDIKSNTRNFIRKRAPAQTGADLLMVMCLFDSPPGHW